MKKILFTIMMLVSATMMLAQRPAVNLVSPQLDYVIKVEDATIKEMGGKVVVALKLKAIQDIPARQSVVLVPELVDTLTNRSHSFPYIYINSRNQQIFFDRELKKIFPDAEAVMKKKGKVLNISYLRYAEYEDWMRNSVLKLQKMSCGCNVFTNRGSDYLCSFTNEQPVIKLYPVFRIPKPEKVKTRQEKGSAYLCYHSNRTEIDPAYMTNPQELQKINNTIHLVKNDPNVEIQDVSIVGYASPEGEEKRNMKLSVDRTESLRQYLNTKGIISSSKVKASSNGENWKGFVAYLNSHYEVPNRSALLSIAASQSGQDEKEALMKKKAAEGFNYCLKHCFPSLRCTEYAVTYIVRPFTIEESEEIFETRPINLSLNEIYMLAGKYSDNHQKYMSIMRKAYLLFPKDECINLTMAYLSIERGIAEDAEEYLKKVSDCPEKTMNMSLVYYLKGDIDNAIRLAKAASQQGVKEAEMQLKEYSKIKEIK